MVEGFLPPDLIFGRTVDFVMTMTAWYFRVTPLISGRLPVIRGGENEA
jgi:hypothetical protein